MATVPSEISALELLHQAAQARLGIAAAYLTMIEWGSVSALNYIGTSAAWMARAVRVMAAIRRKSRATAIAYLQLSSALQTGTTLGPPDGKPDATKETSLAVLRKNFLDEVQDIANLGTGKVSSEDPDLRWFESQVRDRQVEALDEFRKITLSDTDLTDLTKELKRSRSTDNDAKIIIKKFNWPEAMTNDEVDDAFRDLLRKQSVDKGNKAAKAAKANGLLSPEELLVELEDIHDKAGASGSGLVDMIGIQAGRDVIDFAVEKDKRIKRVARGTSGDPCAFCAMLASRGFVYRSEATAGFKAHRNCHCYAIVRWSTDSELPALNQYYKEQWPIITRGYSGNDSLNAWRRWIYAERKAGRAGGRPAVTSQAA